MTGGTEHAGALVIPFHLPAQVIEQQRRQIKAMFPAWTVRHNPVRDSWNAYRDGEPPRFGHAAEMRAHLVSACDVASLVELLEQQVHADIGIEFPGWIIRCGRSGGWYAFPPHVATCHGGAVRLVHAPVLPGLLASLRVLARRDAKAT